MAFSAKFIGNSTFNPCTLNVTIWLRTCFYLTKIQYNILYLRLFIKTLIGDKDEKPKYNLMKKELIGFWLCFSPLVYFFSGASTVNSFFRLPVFRVVSGSNKSNSTSESAIGLCFTPLGTIINSPSLTSTTLSP